MLALIANPPASAMVAGEDTERSGQAGAIENAYEQASSRHKFTRVDMIYGGNMGGVNHARAWLAGRVLIHPRSTTEFLVSKVRPSAPRGA